MWLPSFNDGMTAAVPSLFARVLRILASDYYSGFRRKYRALESTALQPIHHQAHYTFTKGTIFPLPKWGYLFFPPHFTRGGCFCEQVLKKKLSELRRAWSPILIGAVGARGRPDFSLEKIEAGSSQISARIKNKHRTILFAPHAFASQSQEGPSALPSPLVFRTISTDFTPTPCVLCTSNLL